MEKIIELLEKLNSNIERILNQNEKEILTYTKRQAMAYLGVSASAVDYYAKQRGKRFKIAKNAYSISETKLIKKEREVK